MKAAIGLLIGLALASPAGGALAQDRSPARGKAVFDLWCGACHKPLNPGDQPIAGTSSLERNYKGAKPAALEQRADLTADYVRFVVRHGLKSMPFSRKTEIPDPDLDALAAYLTGRPTPATANR